MNIFLVQPSEDELIQLNEEESAHCIRVLRHKAGDTIYMVDGVGGFYTGIITNDETKACIVRRIKKINNYGKRTCSLHIAIAPTKNIDRFEWFLEKATEIGIEEITPLICEHSERRQVKSARLNKVIVAAMKQSVKAYLPKLNEAMSFSDFISSYDTSGKFICSCDVTKDTLLKNQYKPNSDATILIGPEGDFSKEEIVMAEKHGFKTASLGESRLRTETAGIVACGTFELMNQ